MNDALKLTINLEEYLFIKDYKDNSEYRQSFNRLAKKVYGFDFEEWYQQGYWSNKYRPHSLVHNGEVVANVSVNTIDFLVEGELRHTVQIGTVMTAEDYRGRGLSKELMNLIVNEYEDTCELMYLYANDSVLEFYPKFGFVQTEEYVYTRQFTERENKLTYRKINMKDAEDKATITRLISSTLPVSKISMIGNPGLDMFYLTAFMSEDIYYIEELDLATVVEFNDDNMFLMEVFCEKEFDMEEVINSLINKPEMKVTLGFTPLIDTGFSCELLKEEGTTFFVKGKNITGRGKFPILSHA
ncbi:MAG: GNAT family N-acetyltransferase [Mobilitalea sp.]